MNTVTLAILVPLLPFLAGGAGLLLGGRAPGLVRPLAVLPTLAAAVLAILVAARQGGGEAIDAATRYTPTGSVPIDLALHLDGFAVLIAALVGVVACCVQLYSIGYLRDDERYSSYAALVSLFTAAMFLVVYSGDLMVLLIGWEVMGICSYFLIGHYWETAEARSASIKAFLVTKLGDVPFLLGVFALGVDAGTFRINGILTTVVSGPGLDHPTLIALLLLAGAVGKSAQVPLQTWLPDAMAGPTPVSALIHAATMVAAGIYVVARLLPVFAASTAALVVMAVIAALTMVGSALSALAQDDVKRVLAYSTIGQLGYMTGALAVGSRDAAVFHLLSHGAFKALLFLGAGVLIHAAGTNSLTEISRMPRLRAAIPDAYWTMTAGLLALAAIAPFSGFFSKEAVLSAAEHATGSHAPPGVPAAGAWIVLVAGLATALLTAAYAARLWLLAFHGRSGEPAPAEAPQGPPGEAELEAAALGEPAPGHHRPAPVMNAVLWVLFVPTLAFGLTYPLLPDWFGGGSLAPTLATTALGSALAVAGILVMYAAWRRTAAAPASAPRAGTDPGRLLLGPALHRQAAAGFHVDALYHRLFVRPVLAAAELVRFLDRQVIDTYVSGAGALPRLLGTLVRRTQTGNVQTYLSVLLAGSLALGIAAVVAVTGS
ncbi:NADH-quinone oxidoreductase subunit L [Streptomyces polyrhachis]|uniref:NADH-quinone oxidoreductase subunit L n=1 Tax=Streptomyces polyrhachis TaxID=1282885 RepID=A0ABW2GDY7_9ACTN